MSTIRTSTPFNAVTPEQIAADIAREYLELDHLNGMTTVARTREALKSAMVAAYEAGTMQCLVLETKGDTALIVRKENRFLPYVIAYGYRDDADDWGHGTYFYTLSEAVDYWKTYVEGEK